MAAGEFISMLSQKEMFEYQIGQEKDELERYPAEEAEEQIVFELSFNVWIPLKILLPVWIGEDLQYFSLLHCCQLIIIWNS
jgi:hypothetical protein